MTRRSLLNIAAVVSLLLCIAASVLWRASIVRPEIPINKLLTWNGDAIIKIHGVRIFSRHGSLGYEGPPTRTLYCMEVDQSGYLTGRGYYAPGPTTLHFDYSKIVLITLLLPLTRCIYLTNRWLRSHKRDRSLCPNCKYNLTANTSGVCPECGTAVTRGSDRENTTTRQQRGRN